MPAAGRKGTEHRRNDAQPGRPRPLRLAGAAIAVVVLLGAVLVWLGTRGSTSESGATLTDQPAPGTALVLPSTGGQPTTLHGFQGKRVVLYFYEGST